MDHSDVERLRDRHPAWRLLRAANAPLILAFLGRYFVESNHGATSISALAVARTAWLFPGHMPGQPITPSRLGERLRTIGIYAQTGRRAALLASPASSPPRSSPTCSASTRRPQPGGCTRQAVTGRATPPPWHATVPTSTE